MKNSKEFQINSLQPKLVWLCKVHRDTRENNQKQKQNVKNLIIRAGIMFIDLIAVTIGIRDIKVYLHGDYPLSVEREIETKRKRERKKVRERESGWEKIGRRF